MDVSGYIHDLYQWEPKRGVLLDDFFTGRQRCCVLRVVKKSSIRDAVARKIVRGFQIAHVRETQVRWRFVATEIRTRVSSNFASNSIMNQ